MVRRSAAAGAALDDAVTLQQPEPLRQQATRDAGRALEDLPERLAADEQVATMIGVQRWAKISAPRAIGQKWR